MLSQSEYDQAREEGYNAAVMDIAEVLEKLGIDLTLDEDQLTARVREIHSFVPVH